MAKTGLGLRYVPGPPPDLNDVPACIRYFFEELTRVQGVLESGLAGNCDALAVAPARPRDGMIRKADGVNWNPGSGRGYYGYDEVSATWKFLG